MAVDVRVCSWCKHVVGDDDMPQPERVIDRESMPGVSITDTKCKVCTEHDEELKALRAARKAKKERVS
jgi:hypothetical protein